MVLKKHKPSLDGVLKRRRQTVKTYLEALRVTSRDALEELFIVLRGSHRVSDQFVVEAKAYINSLKKLVKKPAVSKKVPTAATTSSKEPVEEVKSPAKPNSKKRPRKVTKKTQSVSEKE